MGCASVLVQDVSCRKDWLWQLDRSVSYINFLECVPDRLEVLPYVPCQVHNAAQYVVDKALNLVSVVCDLA